MRKGEEVTCMAPTVPNPDSAWEPSSLPGHGPPGHGPLGRSKRLRRLRREEGGGIRARSYLHQPQQALSFVADEPPHTHTEAPSHKHSLTYSHTHTEGPVGTIRQAHGHLLSPVTQQRDFQIPQSHTVCVLTLTRNQRTVPRAASCL